MAQEAAPIAVSESRLGPIVEIIPVTGTVTSPQVAQLSTTVGGEVRTVQVDAGDRVETGDLLLELDGELHEIALDEARAASQEAREAVADAQRRLEETRTLVKDNYIAATKVRDLESEVRLDSAVLERLQAEERHQAALVARHVLKAPFSGVISRKLAEAGEWVEPGTPVLELVAVDRLRLDTQVPQSYFPRIDTETHVDVLLDAYPGRHFNGRVAAKVPVNDPNARTFMLRIELDNADARLIPGMSAQARVHLVNGERGVLVPRDALIRYPDGRQSVWLVQGNDNAPTVTEQFVRVGLSFNGDVEIQAGLDAGVRVVTQGNESLREGQAVTIRQHP